LVLKGSQSQAIPQLWREHAAYRAAAALSLRNSDITRVLARLIWMNLVQEVTKKRGKKTTSTDLGSLSRVDTPLPSRFYFSLAVTRYMLVALDEQLRMLITLPLSSLTPRATEEIDEAIESEVYSIPRDNSYDWSRVNASLHQLIEVCRRNQLPTDGSATDLKQRLMERLVRVSGLESTHNSSAAKHLQMLLDGRRLHPPTSSFAGIRQGTDTWLAARRMVITGTLAKYLSKSRATGDDYPATLLRGLYGLASSFSNENTRFGHNSEAGGLDYAEKELGVVLQRGLFVRHPNVSYLAASPDGLCAEQHVLVEVKSSMPKNGVAVVYSKRPTTWDSQIQHTMEVTQSTSCLLVFYNGEDYCSWRVEKDEGFVAKLKRNAAACFEEWLSWYHKEPPDEVVGLQLITKIMLLRQTKNNE
jgi:hypothetical protein